MGEGSAPVAATLQPSVKFVGGIVSVLGGEVESTEA
jgi:hypothetical protein